jgi:hypothetical protein
MKLSCNLYRCSHNIVGDADKEVISIVRQYTDKQNKKQDDDNNDDI